MIKATVKTLTFIATNAAKGLVAEILMAVVFFGKPFGNPLANIGLTFVFFGLAMFYNWLSYCGIQVIIKELRKVRRYNRLRYRQHRFQ